MMSEPTHYDIHGQPIDKRWRPPDTIEIELAVLLPNAIVAGGVKLAIRRALDPTDPVPEMMALTHELRSVVESMHAELAKTLGAHRHQAPRFDYKSPFIVIRPRHGVPTGGACGEDGKWYDRAELERRMLVDPDWASSMRSMTATATQRYEIREDGAIAQVYELGFR